MTGYKDLINAQYYGMPSRAGGRSSRYYEDDVTFANYARPETFSMEEIKMNQRIAIIGSIKHCREEIMEIYNRLTLRGDIVMLPYMGIIPEYEDDDTIEKLHKLHRDKMRMADFVIVVDKDDYIGKDTLADIKWCESQGIRIMYASDMNMVKPAPTKSKK